MNPGTTAAPTGEAALTEASVLGMLRYVIDPELDTDIVDLGLVYGVELKPGGIVEVRMTLTSPGCPYGPALLHQVRQTLKALKGVNRVDVQLVWDPPWGPERMSEDVRLELGFDI
jgi:metal-sulfur cluster biosynthetic enzyme